MMKAATKSNVDGRPLVERLAEATGDKPPTEAPTEPPPPPNSWFGLKGSLRIGDGLEPIGLLPLTAGGPAAAFAPKRRLKRRPKGSADRPPPNLAHYSEALLKLFPIEGVTLAPLVPAIADGSRLLTVSLVALIIALIIFLRAAATQPKQGGKPDWIAVIISVISFLLYAATLEIFGLFLETAQQHVLLMAFLTIAWLAIVPRLPAKRKAKGAQKAARTGAKKANR